MSCCFYCLVYKLAMPIYEYRCEACGQEKEFLQKFSDPLKVDCPACGKPTLVKKVTAAGFQLKGSGWYATDFRNNGGKPAPNTAASTNDSQPSTASVPNTTSTDAKPAAPSNPPAVSVPGVSAPATAGGNTSGTSPVSSPVAAKKAD
jgi:putative FmdB family regulatory protein